MVIFLLIGTKAGAMLEISSAWSCVVAKFTLLNKHQKQKKTVLIIWFNIRKRWKNQRHYQAILYGTPCRETNYCYGISDPRVLQTYIHPCCKDEDVNRARTKVSGFMLANTPYHRSSRMKVVVRSTAPRYSTGPK